ncbi:DUF4133 domain-containing protein [Pedobacter paludis]|uniref:DUF4133 domain-containing protein n=1 Tax=Pedobacter paludis TaxID=2203212 RepID=A0A317F4T5_9SPHI|nr:DUF4133 domain-containing protein [Pedobacter paludis]PWS33333.1 hypothetical protein DF947_01525 [Pedobacter paludis]
MGLVYQVNKGIGRPIGFKGLVGSYIAYLAIGLVLLLLGFTVGYISGVSLYVLLPMVLGLGTLLVWALGRLSKRFGVHGLGKFLSRQNVPVFLRFSSRRLFLDLRVMVSNQERQVH